MDEEKVTKTYRIMINGQDIVVDAATLAVSEKRVKRYIKKLMDVSKEQTKSNRAFWADMIMLNLMTDKILKKASPFMIEQAVAPLSYVKAKGKQRDDMMKEIKEQYEKALSDSPFDDEIRRQRSENT